MKQGHKRFFIVTVSLFLLTLSFLVGNLFSAETQISRTTISSY